jgi:acetyl/propionyl-CoA carboxylase alpha subunit
VHYDPLLAKLITWGRDRDEAIARMARALDEYRIDGIKTSISFHRKVMDHPAFRDGDLDTGFVAAHPELVAPSEDPWLEEVAVVAAAVAHFRRVERASTLAGSSARQARRSPWRSPPAGWRR